jgi:hypothetical protein
MTVQELRLYNCNDLITSDHGLWSLAGFCPGLTTLVVEGINCRIHLPAAAELSRLTKVMGGRQSQAGVQVKQSA